MNTRDGYLMKRRAFLASAAALALCPIASGLAVACTDPAPAPSASWRKLPTPGWPSTVTVIRGSTIRSGEMYVSTGGSQNLDAQAWRWNGTTWSKHSHFNNYRMNVLTSTPINDLIMGLGSQHVPGSARVWKYSALETDSQVGPNFSGQDIIYSMTWLNGELYAGTMAEDSPGAARLKKWTGTAWADVFAPGLNGAPASYTYAAIYETWVSGGKLHIGTMSRTMGDAHVWRLDAGGWVNLGGLAGCDFTLCSVDYDGKMVVGWGGNGSVPKVRYLDANGNWQQLGDFPAEWVGAEIFNHMAVFNGALYVGVGGVAGKLSVWRLDGSTWTKIAGSGQNGSWTAPLNTTGGREWVYRLQEYAGKLHACLAGTNSTCQVWELTA